MLSPMPDHPAMETEMHTIENSVYGSSAGHVWTDPQYDGPDGGSEDESPPTCVECGKQDATCDDLCTGCMVDLINSGGAEIDDTWPTGPGWDDVAEIINEAQRGAADMQLDRAKEIA